MLSVIFLDILFFKFFICILRDVEVVKELGKFVKIKDIEKYGMEMLVIGIFMFKENMKEIIN